MNTRIITAEKVAKLLLSIGAMTFRFNPPFVYSSGLKSPVYLDNRLVMSYPKIRTQIIKFYIHIIKEQIGIENVDVISATATAAIPSGAWVAGSLNLPMVYVRPSTKAYGKGGKVEGVFKKGNKVLIIEDHVSTAESIVNNAQTIRELGGKVKYAVATTTYETERSNNTLKENKVTLLTLTTGKIVNEVALREKRISKEEKESVDTWLADPPNWAKE